MNKKLRFAVTIAFAACFSMTAVSHATDIWLSAPQVCGGRSYSWTAKEANWTYDAEERVAWVSPDSSALPSSVLPIDSGNFSVRVRAQINENAKCVLQLGSHQIVWDRNEVKVNGEAFAIKRDVENAEPWGRLKFRQHDEQISLSLNDEVVKEWPTKLESVSKIELQILAGRVGVSHFHVTGELRKIPRDQTQLHE